MLSPHTPPGAKVECIEGPNAANLAAHERQLGMHINEAVAGKCYTLRGVVNRYGIFGVLVDEIVNPLHPHLGVEMMFRVERFRRVTDISDLQRLLVSAPIKEPAST